MPDYHDLLTPQEEARLLKDACSGDLDARDRIVEHNQRLVRKIATRYYYGGIGGDQELEDLVQLGNFGLLRAIEKWEPAHGLRFSTYAAPWVKAFVYRYGLLNGSPCKLSYRDSERISSIRKARSDMLSQLGREPSTAEIARSTGLEEDFVSGVLSSLLSGITRLDRSASSSGTLPWEGDTEIRDILPASTTAEEEVETRAAIAELRGALRSLDTNEREVITLRYLTDPASSYAAIARNLKVTPGTVKNIERAALVKLRSQIGP